MGGPGGRRKRRLEDAERQRGGVGICMRSVIGIRVGSLSLCRLRGDSRAAGCRELLPSERETSIVVGECPLLNFPSAVICVTVSAPGRQVPARRSAAYKIAPTRNEYVIGAPQTYSISYIGRTVRS